MRKVFILFLIVSILSIITIDPVSAPGTTISVEPEVTINPALVKGSTFPVEIWIRNVVDLAGLEFKLGYDTAVLNATSIDYGGIFGATYFPLTSRIYEAEGYLHYSIMEMFGEPGFSGDGRAAIINFTVDSEGESFLDLFDTRLGDSAANSIVHTTEWGYFSNLPVSATLARRAAWRKGNNFFAIVYNWGTVNTRVKVVFTISDVAGNPIDVVETETIDLAAGTMYGHERDARYKAPFSLGLGRYYVSAVCWVDTDGDAEPDTPMGRIKTFSFKVTP